MWQPSWPGQRHPVHPHGCGEHASPTLNSAANCGSSPRVWGTSLNLACPGKTLRFIPTGVGNILRPVCHRRLQTVHPHGCGEHLLCRTRLPRRAGSSPRVWGTSAVLRAELRARRFIPTGVGNIDGAPVLLTREAVHPHGCGEHLKMGH